MSRIFYPDLILLLELTFASDYLTTNHNCLFDIYLRAEIWCDKSDLKMNNIQSETLQRDNDRQFTVWIWSAMAD